MYRREKPITVKGSTSFLCNNLSVLATLEKNNVSYAVVHKSVVNLITASMDGRTVTGKQVVCKEPSATHGSPFILQAKWVMLPVRTLFVLTTTRGIQMFESDGSAMIYWHALSTDKEDHSNFGRGIAGVDEHFVCVGTESGEIVVLRVPTKGANVTFEEALKGHTCPINDLASEGDNLVSCDDQGNIIVWKSKGAQIQKKNKISGAGSPCHSISLWNGIIVGGYASGHLRVFNLLSGKIGAEVSAHSRCINAVDISKSNGMVLSVSDDAWVRIWMLKEGNLPEIKYVTAENVPNLQLVGGQFVDKQGRAFCVTGYDNNEIIFYIQS
ncbi:WD repeat-containing protein 54-like [Gigantopelta aegis]|uniref:WD repeat-containing protein 54-like n=1 Tax=Gigantopelta aegis TaxID=1735272 RepID=UPI001B88D682|nr:WD repeat-containing protein 54-like [Gigantopelta aegis]